MIFFRNTEGKLIAQFDERDAGLPVLMSADTNIEFNNAMNYYKLGELDSSISIINHMITENSENDTLNYYFAIISEQLSMYDDAVKKYLIVISDKNSLFYSKASFHLGITYLKTKKWNEARNIFSVISSDQNNPFQKKAAELLEKISSK